VKNMLGFSLLLFCSIWVAVACSNNSSTTSPTTVAPTATATPSASVTPVTLTFLYTNYFSTPIGSSQQCSGCHTPGTNGQLNFSTKSAFYTSVVGTTGVVPTYGCGVSVVAANNASNSALYNRLSGASCSPQMPDGGPTYLNSTQLAQVASWINAGAPNN
jgi:hypothetical protein